jgi:apolipoprotein N-acyltransferase
MGWKACMLAFIAGALMALAFAPLHLWPVVFISLPVVYLLLASCITRAQAVWRGFFFGYGYFMAGTWWIANALLVDAAKFAWMLPLSILGLSALMALWFALFGLLAYAVRRRMSPLMFALLWLAIEVARSLGIFGFPWNLAGYIALASLPIAQVASLIGTYGISFIIIAVGLLPVAFIAPQARRTRMRASVTALSVLVACYGFGSARLAEPTPMTTTRVRLVQPNIPQEVKGTPEGQRLAVKLLGELTPTPPSQPLPDVTIWPETAYPSTVHLDDTQSVPKLKLLLTGAVRAEGYRPDIKIWNSIVAIDPQGAVLASYDKHQLVPFGEFVPLRHLLPLDKITPGDIDFSRGAGVRTLSVGNLPPFSPLICYEVIFPHLAVDARHRPAWLLNLTNDAWYGDSAGPHQHFEMTRMRAIEQGLPLLRAANSGISAVIDGRGRILASLALDQRGVIDTLLPAPQAPTLYSFYHF